MITNPAVKRAMASVEAAAGRAEKDPSRPVYHFRPPACWMNDPNGPIYHNGYYHLFYQHNPYGDSWGNIHWGHARSTDLIRWEHLPVALWPSEESGEAHCYSGCSSLDGEGRPILLYTKVALKPEKTPREQWIAVGDRDLIAWEKSPANPILELKSHGGPLFTGEWRDPFLFRAGNRTFLILGAKLAQVGDSVVALYESEDERLMGWRYRRILIRRPPEEIQFFECPNFFRLGQRWILLCSPFNPVEYFIGSFDLKQLTFTPETHGLLDSSKQFYATNVLFDDQDRCILMAWIRGFREGRGWNGCLALPRILTVDENDRPIQMPVPELQTLRSDLQSLSEVVVNDELLLIEGVQGDTLELECTLEVEDACSIGLLVRCSEKGTDGISIVFDGRTLDVDGTVVPIETGETASLSLRIFLDRAVLEVFIDGGKNSVTKVIYPKEKDLGVAAVARGGRAILRNLKTWTMRSIW